MDLKGLLLDYAGVLDDPGDEPSGTPPLLDVARRIRRAGIGTALVSNANGLADPGLTELFDAVVLSGAVGVAKPSLEIYRLTARRLGLEPRQCVFVDDLPRNVSGAVEAGMVGVHHRDVASTVTELAALFELEIRL
ncbi:HAD-IA family hydrolase [Saccharopolyspora sp. NPDC050389]|uniref:HAD-IA family hydrolase n=1 Tax=Saccharopolyspora sp. NPDC050389 TaxID=3155516 RepID=UPI003406C176